MGFSVCLLVLSVVSALEDQVKVKPGEDAALPCQSPGGAAVVVLEWIRPELHDDGYVFLYRNNRSYERYQHPAFRGRVQLREAALKDGDASVILKKVDVNDTGTYKCQIIVIDPGSDERSHVRHLVNLEVTDSGSTGGQTVEGGAKDGGDEEGGDEDGGNTEKSIKNEEKTFGHVGLAVGLSVFGVLFIVCLIVMFRKTVTFTKRLKPRYQPPPKAEVSAAS